MFLVTADLNERIIVANEPDDGDIDEKCMFFVSPGEFVYGFMAPGILFIHGFLSPLLMFIDGCGRAVACNGSTFPVNKPLSKEDDPMESSF